MPPSVAFDQPIPGFVVGGDRHVHVRRHESSDAAVDAQHVAFHVEQRSAGIAADQRTIGGDRGLVLQQHAADPDDGLPAFLEPAGMPSGQAPLPDLHLVRLGQFRVRPRPRSCRFSSGRRPACGTCPRTCRRPPCPSGKNHGRFAIRRARHMRSGQDIAVLADNDSAAVRRADHNAHGTRRHFVAKLPLVLLHRPQLRKRRGLAAIKDLLQRGRTDRRGHRLGPAPKRRPKSVTGHRPTEPRTGGGHSCGSKPSEVDCSYTQTNTESAPICKQFVIF